jgi:hypothetical protein
MSNILFSFDIVFFNVKHRYGFFLLLNRLLRIRLKRQNPVLSHVREREIKYTANVQCSVRYTLLLPYLMLITS